MALDTTAMLHEIDTTHEQVTTRSQGIANLSAFKDFSAAEREFISTLAAKYQKEHEGLQLGHAVFEQLPNAIHVEQWEAMRDKSIEFLLNLESATTYEDWKIVFQLAEEWFRLIREIAKDDTWTDLLGKAGQFFQIMTDSGHPHLPTIPVPESMIATLRQEMAEAQSAQSLFVLEEPAAVTMTLNVSEEEPI